MDGFIRMMCFREWTEFFVEKYDMDTKWEYYLHRVPQWSDMSFNDFLAKFYSVPDAGKEEPAVSEEKLEATVKDSRNILDGFNPNDYKYDS